MYCVHDTGIRTTVGPDLAQRVHHGNVVVSPHARRTRKFRPSVTLDVVSPHVREFSHYGVHVIEGAATVNPDPNAQAQGAFENGRRAPALLWSVSLGARPLDIQTKQLLRILPAIQGTREDPNFRCACRAVWLQDAW